MGQIESSYTKLGTRRISRKVNKDGIENSEQRDTKLEEMKREKTKEKRGRKESLFSSISWKKSVHFPGDDPVSSWPAWYHGWCRKAEVEQKLKDGPEGFFLVKNSTEFPGDLTLCVVCGGEVLYYRVKREGCGYSIDNKELFKDVMIAIVDTPLYTDCLGS